MSGRAKIEGIRIRNYGVLGDVTLGSVRSVPGGKPLGRTTAVIGKNATGKSSLCDVFAFLTDCFAQGVPAACRAGHRGGFGRLHAQGGEGPLSVELRCRPEGRRRTVTWEIEIGEDERGAGYISRERLGPDEEEAGGRRPAPYLLTEEGSGIARDPLWESGAGYAAAEYAEGPAGEEGELEYWHERAQEKTNPGDRAAVTWSATRGVKFPAARGPDGVSRWPAARAVRELVTSWENAALDLGEARRPREGGPQERLRADGANTGNVLAWLQEERPESIRRISERLRNGVPGEYSAKAVATADARTAVMFGDSEGEARFTAREMSDGTLTLLWLLTLLEEPDPPGLRCLEEPARHLGHRLAEEAAELLGTETDESGGGAQRIVTTHRPEFLDGMRPDQTWILRKGPGGLSTAACAGGDRVVTEMTKEHLSLGDLWRSGFLDAI